MDHVWKRFMMKTALILIRGRIPFVMLCLVGLIVMIIQGRYSALTRSNSRDSGIHGVPGISREYPDAVDKEDAQIDHKRKVDTSKSIAIGCAITTTGIRDLRPDNIMYKFPFLRTLLPSFCKTASAGYTYRFYLAFDRTDPFLSRRDSLHQFSDTFREITKEHCSKTSNITLQFVGCNHSGKPAWAQNDAMMDAYLDECEYYYRVNDDSLLQTARWTEQFIHALRNQTLPNVGVVGPTHSGGNEDILTQDFVHKTHIDIFGFYYPRMFSDWWADDWMTLVYQPKKMIKLSTVEVVHTQERGTRYKPRLSTEQSLMDQVKKDQQVLNRYLKSKERRADPKKVISMSIWGDNPRYVYGVLRNAQLVPVFFPEWTLRVYSEKQFLDGLMRYGKLPERILDKLESLGAELTYVDTSKVQAAPMMWRFLVADDSSVDWFIIRDADGRLSDRDAEVVADWLNTSAPFHCIRDHPSHAGYSVLGGLWGGKQDKLKNIIPTPWEGMMRGVGAGYGADMDFLAQVIYPRVQDSLICHDSMSCTQWPNSHPFPSPRHGTEHLGQTFDAFGNPRDEDIDILVGHGSPAACTLSNETSTALAKKPSPHDKLVLEGPSPEFVIWNMDYHIGPIRALKELLQGSKVGFVVKSLSEKCADIEACAVDLKVITAENGLHPTQEEILAFRNEYRDSPEMRQVTHFVCFDPASMCELYMTLNKSIIVVATSRYEKGRVARKHWQKWNENLVQMSREPQNIIAASNKYDQAYLKHFTGLQPMLLPLFCGYTKAVYNPSRPGFLLYPIPSARFQERFMKNLTSSLRFHNLSTTMVQPLRTLYPHYEYPDIAAHRGIIYVPHQVSMVSLCEHYQMNIPLFFPSVNLLVKWHLRYHVLSKLTLNTARELRGVTTKVSPISGVDNSTDPNMDWDRHALKEWLKQADFYQWPHIVYYTSVSDLAAKLQTADLDMMTAGMKAFNDAQGTELKDQWMTILGKTKLMNKN